MAQPFTLKFYDATTTIDFMGTTFTVADGGFDIGMPKTTREYAQTRQGFYIPVKVDKEYREAEIEFEVTGASRSAVLTSLQTLERMLEKLDNRERMFSGQRAEIQYAWSDSVSITYFEVFGGELSYPDDVLSVERVHRLKGSNISVPGCVLKLYLSAYGYGLSIHSTSMTEIPLNNSSVGDKQTGGVTITNPGAGLENFVDIEAADITGQGPMITKISLASGSTYEDWNVLFMGLCTNPQPTAIRFEDADIADIHSGNHVAGGSGGHLEDSISGTIPYFPVLRDYGWVLTKDTKGMFYAFAHGYGTVGEATNQWAVGTDNYTTWNMRKVGNLYKPKSGQAILPLGAIQLPPFEPKTLDIGTQIQGDLRLSLFIAREVSPATVNLDFLYLLPINDGLRVIVAYGDTTVGTTIDDDWTGSLGLVDGSGNIIASHFGVTSPIRLVPNKAQRIYFNAVSDDGTTSERLRQFTVRVYGVPTYRTLAL